MAATHLCLTYTQTGLVLRDTSVHTWDGVRTRAAATVSDIVAAEERVI